jgi:hypothetical protein
MALDPSIILQARQPQLPNPMELAQHAATLRQLGLQSQASQLGIEQSQRALQQEKTLADLYRNNVDPTSGQVNQAGVIGGMAGAGLGEKIPAYQKSLADASKSQTDQQTAEFDLHKKKLDLVGGTLASLVQKPDLTTQDAIDALSGLTQQGVISSQQGAQVARALPGNPQQLRAFLIQQGLKTMDVSKQLDARIKTAPQYNEQDRGAVINEGTIDPLTGQRTAGANVAKEMTPDQKAKIDLQKSGALTDDAKNFMIDRLLNGEKPSVVLGNLGRGAQGASDLRDIQNRLPTIAKERGITGSQLANIMQNTSADARTLTELGAREGKIAPRVQEAQNFAYIAKAASAAVPRGSFVPWNKLSQAADSSISDPALAKLKAATNSLINAYAAAVGGGSPTVHDKEAAEKMLSTAQSPEAYNAVVDQLITETQAALDAPGKVRSNLNTAAGRKPAEAAAGDVPPDIAALLAKHGGK